MMILEQQYHDDLKKELRGVMYTSAGSKETSGVVQTGELATNVEENADDMGKLMMSRKRRKLLEAMQVTFLSFMYVYIFVHFSNYLSELKILISPFLYVTF